MGFFPYSQEFRVQWDNYLFLQEVFLELTSAVYNNNNYSGNVALSIALTKDTLEIESVTLCTFASILWSMAPWMIKLKRKTFFYSWTFVECIIF